MDKVKTVAHLLLAFSLVVAQCASSAERALEFSGSTLAPVLSSETRFVALPLQLLAISASEKELASPQATSLLLGSGGAAASEGSSSKPKWYLLLLGLLAITLIAAAGAGGSADVNNSPVDSPIDQPPVPIEPPVIVAPPDGTTGGATDRDVIEVIKNRDVNSPLRGVFLSAGVNDRERRATDRTGAVENRITQLSFGYDQLVSDSLVIGALFNSSRGDVSTVNTTDSSETDSLSLFVFSSYRVSEQVDLSAYAGYGMQDLSRKRSTSSGNVSSKTDSSNSYVGLAGSRRFILENQFQLSADVGLSYSSTTTDAYVESGSTLSELSYKKDNRDSLQIKLGTGVSKAFSGAFGVIVPNLSLGIVFDPIEPESLVASPVENTQLTIEIEGTPHDRVYGFAEFDIVWVKQRGFQFFTSLNGTFSNRYEKNLGFNIGARLEF